jgi:plastocyanin
VALLPVFLGGIAAAGVFGFPGEEEHGAKGPAAPAVEIAAQNLAFDKKELIVPAGKPFTLNFNNQEAQPHNVAILKSQGSTEVFLREPPAPGPKKISYKVKAIPEGSYYFQCDVHPTMSGTVKAEAGGGGGGEGEAGGGVQISANNLAFDKKDLTVKADQPFKLTFDNKEAQPHNVAILKSPGSTEVFLREPPAPGPKKTTYDVKALPPGKYYFQCDVHPNMNGTVTAS